MPHRLALSVSIATLLVALCLPNAAAASKPHVIGLGKTISVASDPKDPKPATFKIRPLSVDGRVREYTIGPGHEVTDRWFVIRRAFRMNDSLPDEQLARWLWHRGGWLLVDRLTGRISPVNLPEFDALRSEVTWYRDYAAYCGISDDGEKVFTVVAQLNRRKPLLRKALSLDQQPSESEPLSPCPAPVWQRSPARVTFEVHGQPKQTFSVHAHFADELNRQDLEADSD